MKIVNFLIQYRKAFIFVISIAVIAMAARLVYKKIKEPMATQDLDNRWNEYVIDTLNEAVAWEQKRNERYQWQVNQMSREMDSIRVLMDLNNEQIQKLKNRKQNENATNAAYHDWTNDELTKFLSDRYQHERPE
jgi:uncharacterized coiled-coil DUF342 family protein